MFKCIFCDRWNGIRSSVTWFLIINNRIRLHNVFHVALQGKVQRVLIYGLQRPLDSSISTNPVPRKMYVEHMSARNRPVLSVFACSICKFLRSPFSYWNTVFGCGSWRRHKQLLDNLKEKRILKIYRGSTSLHSLENLLWKRLWTCCKALHSEWIHVQSQSLPPGGGEEEGSKGGRSVYAVTHEAALGVDWQAVQTYSGSEPLIVLIHLKWNTITSWSNQHVHRKTLSSPFTPPPLPFRPSPKLSHNDNVWNLPVMHSELILYGCVEEVDHINL